MSGVKFTATDEERAIIQKIAERAYRMDRAEGVPSRWSVGEWLMDIEACHSNGMPLDLQKLLDADDFNFAHDVFQIRRFLNRKTGKLEGFFLPRTARKGN